MFAEIPEWLLRSYVGRAAASDANRTSDPALPASQSISEPDSLDGATLDPAGRKPVMTTTPICVLIG